MPVQKYAKGLIQRTLLKELGGTIRFKWEPAEKSDQTVYRSPSLIRSWSCIQQGLVYNPAMANVITRKDQPHMCHVTARPQLI
jgi:hypothetical protein